MDDINAFKTWASKLGCPPERIPPDETLKKSFRGEQSSMFHQIMTKVRSRHEIAWMRKNVLVHKLQVHKKMDDIVVNATFHTLPTELQRYMKMQKLKKKIDETRNRVKQSLGSLESINLQIKDKNVQKFRLANKLEELYGKASLYIAYDKALKSNIEKEKQLIERINRIMPMKGSESFHPDKAEKAIEICIQLLEGFYEKFQDVNNGSSRNMQEKLWTDIRDILRGVPNYLLWNVLLKMKDSNLSEIAEQNNRREQSEQNVSFSDRDMLQLSMAKLGTSHINVFLDVMSTRNMVNTAREEYLARYSPCSSELEAKMTLMNVMDDEAEEALEEYLMQWNSREYNQGQTEYMDREIERKKQELLLYSQKNQNHEQLLSQLRGIYGQIEDISKHMEAGLHQVRQIKQKVHYSKYMCQHTVHTIRQKNGNNQTLNMSDQSFSRLDNSIVGASGPTYGPAVLPSFVQELEVFGQIPLFKYANISKALQFSVEPNAALIFDLPIVLALLPTTAVSPESSLKQLIAMQELEQRANSGSVDSCSVVGVSIEHAALEMRWKNNHGKICEMLDKIDAITSCTRQMLERARTYYNFVLANNLRKYVPATKLFNGRSFQEYENEYLMYYRMIYGFGGN
ncbi:augmin complex subunit dgt5 [Anopheles nili]|uniref:augmin complex subunit dgt5 n=1 Tax=Anopheles nili TaxID=185578 RepID=UPI00237ADFA9|nr:augmin complex subunit dgt5 [Anopheles nili]